MEPVIRYDFSFPPKAPTINTSNQNNNGLQQTISSINCSQRPPHPGNNSYQQSQQQLQHRQKTVYSSDRHFNHNGSLGLCKSASTSLLSCATNSSSSTNQSNLYLNNNTCYNNNNYKSCCTSCTSGKYNKDSHLMATNNNSSYANKNILNTFQMPNGLIPIKDQPQTPKDSNCSFTFDELKNTLAFMEDSPLVTNASNNANNSNESHLMSREQQNSTVTEELVVLPSLSDCTSALSSSGSSTSSCCTSNSAQSLMQSNGSSYLPKSTSNPMLLCSAIANSSSMTASGASSCSSSTASTTSTSPCLSASSSSSHLNNHNHQHQKQQQNILHTVISECSCSNETISNHKKHYSNNDLNETQLKRSPSSSSLAYDRSSNKAKIASTANNANSLLATKQNSRQQQQQQQQQQLQHQSINNNSNINTAVESAAKKYRCAAQISEATCFWKGKLPPKQYKIPIVYSNKVFVGGLPWDITEEDLVKEFGVFGPCRVEWTNKEKHNLLSNNSCFDLASQNSFRSHKSMSSLHNNNNNNMHMYNGSNGKQGNGMMMSQNNQNGNNNDPLNASKQRQSPGFAYVIYENEYSVRSLVGNCIEDYQNGRDRVEYFFKISTRRVRNKEVQIIPWILADNNYALCTPKELDPKKTVFVGNLHGTMTARDLAHIMNELFGCVVYAGIDIDKLKYPIGSGRVTFSHQQNFMRAVRAAFVDIKSSKFSKRIQIDPYLEDVQCCLCYSDKGIYFCRDFQCFNYYCGTCWEKQHSFNQQMGSHKPLMRKREDK